jgi:subtilisin family serine protease
LKFNKKYDSIYADDEILVKFKPTVSFEQIEATLFSYKTKKIKRIPRINVYELKIPKEYTVDEMIKAFQENPDVEFAEPNYIAHITVMPNDDFFEYQYALHNRGQEIGPGGPSGKTGADINAPEAWNEEKGKENVIIAIVDTGIDLNHPDLKNKIYSSGYDFANDDPLAMDDHGHGTHCAGIAAADTNNKEGIAGVAWNCKLLPVKVMNKEGFGLYSWISEGIIWAADQNASVINLSIGGEFPSNTLRAALEYAYNKGVVIVAAAGNEGGSVLYPAAYDEYCLAVAAIDYNDLRVTLLTYTWESNFGPEIDVAAPGVRILSTYPVSLTPSGYLPYAWGSGTSMAAPHVAGLAALIKSLKPWLKVEQIMDIIRYSCDDINSNSYPGKDDYLGYGRINMEKALVPIELK